MTTTPDPSMVILYVEDAPKSAAFYAGLLNKAPLDASPLFAMFALDSGAKLGLWARRDVAPAATASGGGAELCVRMADKAAVQATHEAWKARSMAIAQAPTQMDFGFTFVGCDPDGHRIRVFCPVEA